MYSIYSRPIQPRLYAAILIAGVFLLPSPRAAADDLSAVSDDRQNTAIRADEYSSQLDESKGAKAVGASSPQQKNSYTLGSLSGVYGANATVTFRWYRDIDNQDANEDFLKWSLQERASVWTSFSVDGWRGYVRGSMENIDRGVGSSYTGIGADVEGPRLDLAFVVRDLPTPDPNVPLRVTAGRQVQYVGRGLSYFAIGDGFQVEILNPVFTHKYFAAKTLPRQDNIDFSVPGFDKNGDRFFYGGEWTYNGIARTSIYGYAFGQEDESHPNPVSRPSYQYDSFHYGTGFSSKPFGMLQLWGELVGEAGHGWTDPLRVNNQRRTDVESWAWILGGKHPWNLPMRPTIEAEAAYGSGDPDRLLVTTTENGSADVRDANFMYFGYYAAGYALQPRLSNLYVYSLGFNFQPLEKHPAFERFLIGGKGYVYFKDEEDGGTSDFESAGHSEDLGNEWDAYIHWQVMPNLLWSLRYGIFLPRGGFPSDLREPTQFFYTRLSLDF